MQQAPNYPGESVKRSLTRGGGTVVPTRTPYPLARSATLTPSKNLMRNFVSAGRMPFTRSQSRSSQDAGLRSPSQQLPVPPRSDASTDSPRNRPTKFSRSTSAPAMRAPPIPRLQLPQPSDNPPPPVATRPVRVGGLRTLLKGRVIVGPPVLVPPAPAKKIFLDFNGPGPHPHRTLRTTEVKPSLTSLRRERLAQAKRLV